MLQTNGHKQLSAHGAHLDAEVRGYKLTDIPIIIQVIMEEVPKLPHYANIKIDPGRLRQILEQSVNDNSTFMAKLLVVDEVPVGGVCAYCVTQILSWDKHANDLFLFVRPEFRTIINAKKLVRAYIAWAKAQNAKLISATHTGGYRPTLMDMFMRSCGFEEVGAMYMLRNDTDPA